FPISISTEEQRLRTNKVENALLCFYYGALVVMAVYNLFVFISTKLSSYLFYVIYVVNVGVFLFFVEGLGLAFIIPNSGEWNRFLINASGMLLFASTVTFIRSFLKTKIRTPTLDKALFILPIVVLGFIPLAGTRLGALALIIISPLTIFIILYSTIKVLNQGHAEAKLFLLGWLSLITGICYQASVYMGLLPWTIFTKYAVHIGSFAEVVLIALALANQINTYRNQKEIAEEEAKRRLLERNEALIETNRLKNEFIATISHEMRTPLNGIVGSLDLALDGPEDLAGNLNDALMSSKNLGSIIDDILLLSELLSGDSEFLEKECNVNEIIDQAISAEEPLAKGKNICIEVSHSGSIAGMVKSDPPKLIKVIRHVLNNAIKFAPIDSSIQISSLLEQSQEGELTLQVIICDNGPGIDPSLSESIFDAFCQADNSFRRSHGGLGIGLTLVKSLVKILNGNVNIESNNPKGTRVELVFPLKKVAKDYIKGNSPLSVRCLKNIQKVLVVEDNPVNQKVLVAILSRLHYQADTADNGKLAVEKCLQSSYDLVFMDCQMPEMDGFEATESIRKLDNSNNAALIVAVTANATEKDRQRCYQVGMDDFTKKPVRLETIDNILKIHGAGNM
ncbi:MAG: response regulator, partial [Pseudomonadales bacterium]|nr:response regulator [Pseudomonadales bacterium]